MRLSAHNPAIEGIAPRPSRREMPVLTREQAQQAVRAVEGSRYGDVYLAGLYTGMRRSELLGLRWPQAHLDRNEVEVIAGPHWIPGRGLVLFSPKSKKSRRTVGIPQVLVDRLRAIQGGQITHAESMGLR